LVKPINEFFLALIIDIPSLIYMLTAFILILLIIFHEGIVLSLNNTLLAILFYIVALPMYFFILTGFRSLVFWFGEVWQIENIYNSLLYSFDNIPIIIIPRTLMILFISITPVAYFNWYIPTGILLGKFSLGFILEMLALTIAINIFLGGIALLIYKKGLRKYEGFGG